MIKDNIDLVVIGHTVIDNIIFNGRNEILPGGSGPAVAMAAVENGVKVGLLTRIGKDFPVPWFNILKKYIDMEGICVENGETSRIKIDYSNDENIKDINISLNVSARFCDLTFPEHYRSAGFMHICPLPIRDQLEIIKKCSDDCMISIDFNQVYESEYNENPSIIREIIKNANIIFPNEFETRIITGTDNIKESAKILYDMGPSFVIITMGSKGAILYDGKELKLYHSQNADNIVDPTGCGDAFIGGFFNTYIRTGDINKSIKNANIIAAKKIMKKGAWMIDESNDEM